jgi:hypothetical protein
MTKLYLVTIGPNYRKLVYLKQLMLKQIRCCGVFVVISCPEEKFLLYLLHFICIHSQEESTTFGTPG